MGKWGLTCQCEGTQPQILIPHCPWVDEANRKKNKQQGTTLKSLELDIKLGSDK